MSKEKSNLDLVIPIYLDSNTLLDLLASIEDGFSVVDKITTHTSGSKSNEISASGEFGIGGIFNVFKINLRGDAKKGTTRNSGEESQTERYHTYGSLLNKLRNSLAKENLIKEITDENTYEKVQTSDFIEIHGKFIPNPFVDSMQKLNGILDLITNLYASTGMEIPTNLTQIEQVKNMLSTLVKDLEREKMQTFIVEPINYPKYKVIVSLFSEYMRDRSGGELPQGEFKLLGKITRKIPKGQKINLIKGSSISTLGPTIMGQLLTVFKGVGQSGMNIPEIVTEIESPVIEVIPISVFV